MGTGGIERSASMVGEKKMMGSRKSKGSGRRFVAALITVTAAFLLWAVSASANQMALEAFDGEVFNLDGDGNRVAAEQAGSHPDGAWTSFMVEDEVREDGLLYPTSSIKDVEVNLPAGLVGNPQATPERCTERGLNVGLGLSDDVAPEGCPLSSQIGWVTVKTSERYRNVPIFNMVPNRPDVAAQFGFNVAVTGPIILEPELRTEEDYGLNVVSRNASQVSGVISITANLFGVPADSANDPERGLCLLINYPTVDTPPERPPGAFGCPSPVLPEDAEPFLTLPTSCVGPVETRLRVDSWQEPGVFDERSFMSHTPGDPEDLIGVEGCETVPFEPEIELSADSTQAGSPAGFKVDLRVPQPMEVEGVESAHVRDVTVQMPEGVRINPSVADGLEACTDQQIGLKSRAANSCPEASKIGQVKVHTPLLADPLDGEIYVGSQLPQERYRIFFAVEEKGLAIKLKGVVTPDPETGRLTAVFRDNPQLPFNHMEVQFRGGARSPLVLPETCGTHNLSSQMSAWSGADAIPQSSIVVSEGCVADRAERGFNPGFQGGMRNADAGAFSPFVMRLTRADLQQEFDRITLTNPEGLSARLAGVPYCPEAQINQALARTGIGQGQVEQADPSCGAGSRVGRTVIGAGAGPNPYYVEGGVYLAGPYAGAPLSLVFIVAAVAGPFDLGVQVVRAGLHVDERTARITAISDQIPKILEGVPLNIRDIRVEIDRENFTLNPTNCAEQAVWGTMFGTYGAETGVGNRFQVEGCRELGFEPRFGMRIMDQGRKSTLRSWNPKMRFVVRPRPGDANMGPTRVTLPPSVILDQGNIRTICTRAQFAERNCPQRAIYGYAKAWSPLLDEPVEGPVYLGSSTNELPDIIADLDGQVRVVLQGQIDTARGGRIRNSFDVVPDVPVSRFVLTMQGGKRKGILVNSTDLCQDKRRGVANFRGQNGKRHTIRPRIGMRFNGCKQVRRKMARKQARQSQARHAAINGPIRNWSAQN